MGEYTPLQLVADFVTLVTTYQNGFMIILEPYQPRTPHIPDPILQLACLGAWFAMPPLVWGLSHRLALPRYMVHSQTHRWPSSLSSIVSSP